MEGGQYDFNEIQRRRERERRARGQEQRARGQGDQKKSSGFFSTFFSSSTIPSRANPYSSDSQIKSLGAVGSIVQLMFYLSTFALVGFLLLIVLHYTTYPVFSFMPGAPGIISVPVPTNRQQDFVNAIAPADKSADFKNILSSQYTLSFDAFIQSDFVIQNAPRILLYNSVNPFILSATDTISTVRVTNTNLIVYLDSQINDLYVRVITGPSTYIESKPIKNIPLRTPFRITIMLSSVLLEVYLNGALQQTLPLGNTPPATTRSSAFFGPPVLVQQAVTVTNISYWNTMLPSTSIRLYAGEAFTPILTATAKYQS